MKMSLDDIIKLNVGGTRFETTRGTLIKYDTSMLAKMFDPESPMRPGALTEDGAYFIDRDPEPFKAILSFLRNGEIDEESKVALKSILREASYFQLSDLEDEINRRLSAFVDSEVSEDLIRINVGGKLFLTTKETLFRVKKLKRIVEGKSEHLKDEDGNIFLDADPTAFAYLLEVLRTRRRREVDLYPEDRMLDVKCLKSLCKQLEIQSETEGLGEIVRINIQ